MIISNSKKFIFFHVPKCAGTTLCTKLAPYSENLDNYSVLKNNINDLINTLYTPEHYSIFKKVVETLPDVAIPKFFKRHPNALSWMNLVHYKCELHPILDAPYDLFPTQVDDPKRYGADSVNNAIVGKYTPFRDHLKDNWEIYKTYHRFTIVRNSWDYVFSIFKNKIVVDEVASIYKEGDDWDQMIKDRLTKLNFLDFVHNMKKNKYKNVVNDFIWHTDAKYNRLIKNQSCYFTSHDGFKFANQVIELKNLKSQLPELEEKIGINLSIENSFNVSTREKITTKDFYDQQAIDTVADIFKQDIKQFNFQFGE